MFYGRVKRKADKKVQVRKTVRIEMRRIANLYMHLLNQSNITHRYKNALDMFSQQNFRSLREAIDVYCTNVSGKMKPGLKQNLYYLLKRCAKALKALMMCDNKEEESDMVERFIQILELWEDFIFGDAQYELNKHRQINLRRPEMLPNEADIKLVQSYVLSRMKYIVEDSFEFWNSSRFVELRNCACTRLTLLNARRGGEPSRIMIDEWKDAMKDNWIDKQRLKKLDEVDQLLIKSLKVTYLTGKGNNHLVPPLIPADTTAALAMLANEEIRKVSGIRADNEYLFASIRVSEDHVSGWHSLHNVCDVLPLKEPGKIKSTTNRHRVSTLFAALDLSKTDRQYFYKHMGHSESINKDIYQAPLAMMAITKVGKYLLDIDGGKIYLCVFNI